MSAELGESIRVRGVLISAQRPFRLCALGEPAHQEGRLLPELLIDFITTLDGYGAADGWPGWWGLEGPEYLSWLGAQPEGAYTILMGANTYRLMSAFAEAGEPGTDVLAGFSKVVFSSTLREPLTWPNTRLVSEDAVKAVREMKRSGRDMRTLGSLTLCRSLLSAGLADRFRVVMFPVITGSTGRNGFTTAIPTSPWR